MHDPLPMKIIFNLFLVLSYCEVILRTPRYWLVGVVSCNFKICQVIHFTADHAQQATLRANFKFLSSTSQKTYTWNNLAKVADEDQNGPGLCGFAEESGSDLAKTAY